MSFRICLQHVLILLIVGVELAAQQPVTPPPAPTASEEKQVRLEMPKASVADVLELYRLLTGKNVSSDPQTKEMTVNLTAGKAMTRTEAIQFIENSLTVAGYAFTPSGENAVKLIDLQQGKRPAQKDPPKRFFTAPGPPAAPVTSQPKQP